METTRVRNNVRAIAAIAAIGGLLFGFDTGIISGALLYLKDDFGLGSFTKGLVVASLVGGAALGAVAGGSVAERLGRRRTLLAVAGTFVVGTAIVSLTPNLPLLVAGRIVLGLAVGAASVTVPLYISELAPERERGGLVSLNQLMITIGIVAAYGVDSAFSPSHNWRLMFAAGAIPAIALAVGALRVPETPRWLLLYGRRDEAAAVLGAVREPDQVEPELEAIVASARTPGTWRDAFEPSIRPLLMIGVALAVFQQVTGINTVIYYAPTILKSAGLSSVSSVISGAGIGAVNVAMTVLAIRLIDKRGRRPLLLAGLVGMIATLGALGAVFAIGLHGATGWIALVLLMLYVASFAIGLGPVFWLLISEIYPLRVRSSAMAIAGMANWAANFAVSLTFLLLIDALGRAATFWTYGAMATLALVYVWRAVPETTGASLEALEQRFVGALPDVVIRPLTSSDSAALLQAFEHLSPETRRLRFLSAGAHMTVRDAERLTTVDHREHEALAAIRPATDEIIGVARYIGLPSDPGVAEIAVAVVDDWQGQGIGRRLVTPLVERARENGFERLIAYVGPENRRVIDWLERHGAKHSPNKTGLVYTLELNTAAPLQRAA